MILDKPYNRTEFLGFLKEFLPGFEKDLRPAANQHLKVTQGVSFLGECPEMELSVFELTNTSSTEARVSLASDGFRIMKDHGIYHALVVYKVENEKNWRLSLMTASPELTDKGKVKLSFSNPRRYSYLLGPEAKINTPHKFLYSEGQVHDLDELQNRFSLEVVNKEFYKQISEHFAKLVGGTLGIGPHQRNYQTLIRLPSIGDRTQASLEFAVRLIGRIIFCWFLREKKSPDGLSLMPGELLSLEALETNKDYYHTVLEPIFFEVLNRPAIFRKEPFIQEPFSLIPYLNGGLFSPHPDDFYSSDEGKQAVNHNIVAIPDSWVKELFRTLETYNFTIDENTIFDEELSIDPEMLGRIFENLLAEINPETGESARKSTGSYYTPRAIVDYMVDESLVLFLNEKTGIAETELRTLLAYDFTDEAEETLTEGEKQQIANALDKLKLLDPACGSGAFPIGALQKIVFVLQQIDPEGHLWFESQIKRMPPELRKLIEREFKHRNFDYIRKLGIIRENIYGVDIQPIATEIARLRCFLTLIVDQTVNDNVENRNVQALPNLEFKFVTANSLIGLTQDQASTNSSKQLSMFDDKETIDELKTIRAGYFTASGLEREQLKTEFVQAQKKLIQELIKNHGYIGAAQAEISQKLAEWDPFSNKPNGWFDPEWMFGLGGGFDIVIANPPYVDSETMVKDPNNLREVYKNLYSAASGNWDLYIPFLELGFNLLSDLGIACFITPNKWLAIGYGKGIRNLLQRGLYRIGNCNSINVFDAGNSPVITYYQRYSRNNYIWIDVYNENYQIDKSAKIKRDHLTPNFGVLLSAHLPIVKKIRSQENTVADFYNVENPFTVSEAYEMKEILYDGINEEEYSSFYKFVNTGTIDPFLPLWGLKRTTYLKTKYSNPVVSKSIFMERFPKRFEQTNRPKLIISGMRHFESFFDEDGEYIAGKSTEILVQKSRLSLELILGLLNSTLIRFYIKEVYGVLGIDGGINFTTDLIARLPFPKPLVKGMPEFEDLVGKILSMTKAADYFRNPTKQAQMRDYKKALDELVFELYGLNDEESMIVESHS